MSEPKDPTPPNSFESKLNIFRARLNSLQVELEGLKGIVERLEEIYTSPLPSSLETSSDFGDHIIEFTSARNAFTIKYNEMHDYVVNVIGSDPASDAPDRLRRIATATTEIVALEQEAEKLNTYVFSLQFPRPPKTN